MQGEILNNLYVFQESDSGIHENLLPHQCDELTRNAQTILMMLSFGAYREVLAVVSVGGSGEVHGE